MWCSPTVGTIPGEIVVGSIGVRPDAVLAEMAGLALGPNGGIAVDELGRTSDPDIYAVGDAVEKEDWVGGGTSLIALANIANRQGRRVADHICGLATRRLPVARHRDRQGVRPDGRHDRLEREATRSRGTQVPDDPLASSEPCGLLPGRTADVTQAPLRPR